MKDTLLYVYEIIAMKLIFRNMIGHVLASAYEACNHMCMPLHTPKALETCKKSTPCFIQKASRCAAERTSKTTMFLIFCILYNTKILQENHLHFLFHWFSGEN